MNELMRAFRKVARKGAAANTYRNATAYRIGLEAAFAVEEEVKRRGFDEPTASLVRLAGCVVADAIHVQLQRRALRAKSPRAARGRR